MLGWGLALVNVVICVGLLVVLPIGLGLIPELGLDRVRRLWPVAAVPAACSVWLPHGWVAATLAVGYLAVAGVLLAHGVRLLPTRRRPRSSEVAVATALAAPMVGSCALVAERSGHRLFGFDLDVLALTVAHFHYAGFAAALVAGLLCRLTNFALCGLLGWRRLRALPAGETRRRAVRPTSGTSGASPRPR